MGSRRRPNPFLALALGVGLSAVVACAGFVHTDDGCTFETHCRSCLWAANTIVVVAPVMVVRPVVEIVAEAPSSATPATPQVAGRSAASRGPPRSA